jgi:hypothetical protein
MYEDARNMPWLYCLDSILNNMADRIAMLREEHRKKVGVTPECAGLLRKHWQNFALYKIIQLEENGDKYKVTRPKKIISKQPTSLI